MVKVFRVWRNKEALKMGRNKRNRNIRYVIFRKSTLKKLSEHLVLQSNIFLYFCDRFSKLKMFFPFLDPLFFTFLADLSKRNVALFWEWLIIVLYAVWKGNYGNIKYGWTTVWQTPWVTLFYLLRVWFVLAFCYLQQTKGIRTLYSRDNMSL